MKLYMVDYPSSTPEYFDTAKMANQRIESLASEGIGGITLSVVFVPVNAETIIRLLNGDGAIESEKMIRRVN